MATGIRVYDIKFFSQDGLVEVEIIQVCQHVYTCL